MPNPLPLPPQTHVTVGCNLLSLVNTLLARGGPAAQQELRRQRVGQVLGLPGQGPGVGLRGPDDPAWLAARPLTPLQQ